MKLHVKRMLCPIVFVHLSKYRLISTCAICVNSSLSDNMEINLRFFKKKDMKLISFVIVMFVVVQSFVILRSCVTKSTRVLSDSEISESGNASESDETRASLGNIMLAIELSDRIGYTSFTASVIRKYHEIPDVDIYVFPRRRTTYTYKSLSTWYGREVTILPYQLSRFCHVLKIFTESSYEILFLSDSEVIFMWNWKEFLIEQVRKNYRQFISLYHSATLHSSEKDCDVNAAGACEGMVSGKTGIALEKKFAKRILSRYPDMVDRFDWNQILKKENTSSIFPAKSLLMRIGQTNQDQNYCGENEVPYGFRLCDFPIWIRDGVEFYFDRCTNPQERYSTGISRTQSSIENRDWVQPVVAYSFYGNLSRYVKGALDNVKRVFTIYPGWKIWMYIDNTVDPETVNELCSYNVKFVNMTGDTIENRMSWKFLIATQPVKYFTVLDVDYRMLARGRAATEEWLQSGRTFHVMRDHPNHSKDPMNGGMWGGYGNSLPNMRQLIAEFEGRDDYMVDIHFLTAKVWPIVKKSVWVHDAYSLHKFGEDHPFPTKREKNNGFVGDVNYS